jgi:hypothetical protein
MLFQAVPEPTPLFGVFDQFQSNWRVLMKRPGEQDR